MPQEVAAPQRSQRCLRGRCAGNRKRPPPLGRAASPTRPPARYRRGYSARRCSIKPQPAPGLRPGLSPSPSPNQAPCSSITLRWPSTAAPGTATRRGAGRCRSACTRRPCTACAASSYQSTSCASCCVRCIRRWASRLAARLHVQTGGPSCTAPFSRSGSGWPHLQPRPASRLQPRPEAGQPRVLPGHTGPVSLTGTLLREQLT